MSRNTYRRHLYCIQVPFVIFALHVFLYLVVLAGIVEESVHSNITRYVITPMIIVQAVCLLINIKRGFR